MAWIEKVFVSQRDSAILGTNCKCLCLMAQPSRPVTKRWSQGELRHSGGRGKIAERAHHRFPANIEGIGFGQKMHALNNAIGFEHQKPAAGGHFHHSAVIARASNHRFPERKTRQKLVEQPVLTKFPAANPFRLRTNPSRVRTCGGLAQFHCRKISGNASTVSVSELKSECIVMATRIEPLHS